MIDRIIRSFFPKEERFAELFAQGTGVLVESAELFTHLARTTDFPERKRMATELKELERRGDTINRQLFEAMATTFITPIDREDLRRMANDLDDIVDRLESVGTTLVLFELKESPEPLFQLATVLRGQAQEVERATAAVFAGDRERIIRAAQDRIGELENEADTIYQNELARLFLGASGLETLEILKWKEVYDSLETASDACKDYAHCLADILLKNA